MRQCYPSERRSLAARRALTTMIATVALALGTGPIAAQAPEGYHLTADTLLLPDSLDASYRQGRFVIHIRRTATEDRARELIRTAERATPERRLIEAAGNEYMEEMGKRKGRWPDNFAEAAAIPGDRWWWHEWDGTLLPYALTGAAVAHLTGRLRELARNPWGEPDAEPRGSFRYEARVEADGAGYVVLQTAAWSYWCGRLCALWFEVERRVFFGPDGTIIRIEGDGPTPYAVS